MYIIKNRNGEQVNEITLKPAEWCTFIGSKGGEYIITNAYGRMSVSKPGTIDEIKATKEIRNAPIYIVAPGEGKIIPAPAQEEPAVEAEPKEIKLQGIHDKQKAKAVKELHKGDVIMWNFGYTSEVVDVIFSKTGKTATVTLKSNTDGIIRDRKMGANTLVAIAHIDEIAPAHEETAVEAEPTPAETSEDVPTPKNYCQGSSIQTVKEVLKSNSPWLELVAEKHFETGETNLIYASGNDVITYYFDRNGGFVVANYAEGIAGAVRSDFAQITESAETSKNVPAVSPIDETAAKRGHESYSTSDYKPGSATAAYNAAVADVRAAADDVRERIPEEYRGELDKLVNRYAVKLADWTNRKNRADASCPSWFITGAAKYPHKKHERQIQQLDKLFKEYDQITALAERIKNFDYECKHRPIKAGDVNAADKLRAKVEELTALQNQMKQVNAEARRRGEPAPYGAYSLSNNRQNLKRYADRLAALEKAKTASTAQTEPIEGEGFRIVRNTDIMRLQILFDGKPDEQTRTLLKSNGFKWAPSQKAWQRQLTANAERAARTVAASL